MNKSKSNILIMMTMMFVCCAYLCTLTIATNILCVRKNSIFKYSSFFLAVQYIQFTSKKKIDFCHFIDGTNVWHNNNNNKNSRTNLPTHICFMNFFLPNNYCIYTATTTLEYATCNFVFVFVLFYPPGKNSQNVEYIHDKHTYTIKMKNGNFVFFLSNLIFLYR